MELVKLTNIGTGAFIATHNGKTYKVDAGENSYVVIDVNVAKHWLGDWEITEEEAKDRETKRLKMLWGDSVKEWKMKVEKLVIEKKEQENPNVVPDPVFNVNDNVVLDEKPEEPEFEDLDKLVDKKAKSKPKSKE